MKPADKLNILERGLTLHRAARFADALPLYRDVLAAAPNDPDALNLAADACFSLGDFTAAAGYLEKLAAGDPRDARNRFNLGVAYQQAGNAVDAARAFQAALDIDPLYPKGWFNLGVALEKSGRIDAAATAYENAVEADAGDAAAIANLAGALAKMRAFNRALAIYDSAIQRWPREPRIRLMQAAAFREIEVYDRAAEACRVAVSLDPENADTHAALALTLALAGKHAESVAANRLALERDSGRNASKTILAGSLIELGEFDEALALSDAVIGSDGRNVSALRHKGNALAGVARYGEAIDVFRAALAIAPEDAGVLAGCADALTRAGREAEIIGMFEAAIATQPVSPEPYAAFARRYLETGQPGPALAVTSQGLARFPADTALLAAQAVAAAAAGDTEIAGILLDFNRLMARIDVAAPTGWKSVAAFNAALAGHVRNHPSIEFAPPEHATRDGYHTGELLLEPMGPIAGLEELIRSAVDKYRDVHPRDPAHPFLARIPDRFGLNIWSIILQQAGHQVPHIHSAAWLSGVYYPQLPPVIGEDDHAGWIEFGQPPEQIACGRDPDVLLMRPEEGLMLLFPSYMYHRTIPFSGDGTRISIAFDVSLVG